MLGLGNMGGMMGKLQEMQKQMNDIKNKLDAIEVEGQSQGNYVKVKINGNRIPKEVTLSDTFKDLNKEDMQKHVLEALKDGLFKAEKVNEDQMKNVAGSMMPGLGSLLGK